MKITQERDLITVDNNGARVELVGESYEQSVRELKRITDVSFGEYVFSKDEKELSEYSLNVMFCDYVSAWAKRDELSEIGVDI